MKRSRLLSLVITLYSVSAQAVMDQPSTEVILHEIRARQGAIIACDQALTELECMHLKALHNMALYLKKDTREAFTEGLMDFNRDLEDPKKSFDTSFASLEKHLNVIKNNMATNEAPKDLDLQRYQQDMSGILTITRQANILNSNIKQHHQEIIDLVQAAHWMPSEQKLECLIGDDHGFYEYKKVITQYMVEHEGKDHNGIAWYDQLQGYAIQKTPLIAAIYKNDAEFIQYLNAQTNQRIQSLSNTK